VTAHQHASRAAIPPPPREVVVSDPHNLERFVIAQDANGIYERAVAELRCGHKASHWMWFVFPQLAHPGQSPTSRRFAITSSQEATAYLQHPVLGPRLRQCAGLLATTADRTAEQIFGDVDAQKLHSCMTLFARVGPTEVVFEQILHRYFASTACTASTDTAGDLRSAVHAAGLAAGWRDVVRVAFVWTMSNEPLARRMGRWAASPVALHGLAVVHRRGPGVPPHRPPRRGGRERENADRVRGAATTALAHQHVRWCAGRCTRWGGGGGLPRSARARSPDRPRHSAAHRRSVSRPARRGQRPPRRMVGSRAPEGEAARGGQT